MSAKDLQSANIGAVVYYVTVQHTQGWHEREKFTCDLIQKVWSMQSNIWISQSDSGNTFQTK